MKKKLHLIIQDKGQESILISDICTFDISVFRFSPLTDPDVPWPGIYSVLGRDPVDDPRSTWCREHLPLRKTRHRLPGIILKGDAGANLQYCFMYHHHGLLVPHKEAAFKVSL